MLDKLVHLDQQLFLYLNNLGSPEWDGFWLFMTNKFSSIPLYVALLGFSIWRFRWKKTLLILIGVALMIAATDQLANLFKYGVERLRPCHDEDINAYMRLVKASCGGKFGYFSAHAANSFAVATFFSLLFKDIMKWLPPFLLIWAIIVAYSRIYIGVHYPLDVITGISIGLLMGWIFQSLYLKLTLKLNYA
ncbi:undecaprenyl-diphosphatase [Zhouia amylolytica]|uniref:Undecaprenyl-diphosphatase n=1 Tax=Zhouia amylolytica TaxID=376730 RepID=A0A1I6QD24_9FLAO|nr:phosphatase PAP2 family protein [Zhouia amylolytica]MCQ0111331.1 phosphatase PAP2 family protein [Zhouia amylolytica]SFS50312.1 undecaprenyl-diphosphatase [Zhouia amylolytica]